MPSPLWNPSTERVARARITDFTASVNQAFDLQLSGYEALRAWSLSHSEAFWSQLWDYFGVIGDKGDAPYLTNGDAMPGAQWFPQSRLNFAENLLRRRDDSPALIVTDERGRRQEMSWAELYRQVSGLSQALRASGVEPGDRVAGLLPNGKEAVIAMLATAALGAVWSSCSPDFGLQGVMDRFGQIAPTVLFSVNGYYYNGKLIDIGEKVDAIAAQLPQLKHLVIADFLDDDRLPSHKKTLRWDDYFSASDAAIRFEPRAFNDPLYILYSSGTTGVPKCIVHGVGGTLLQHLKELALHTDIHADDTLFYYTTCGWMMWNWLVSGLALGATLVLYDGSPFHPGPDTLWQLAEQERINTFGASAKYYAACEKAGYVPREHHDLSALSSLLSTGSPLSHESFDYLYREVKADLCLSSISGGTDIISCFALGCPTLPVYRGELQCLGLAMDVHFYDDDGQPLAAGKGELVCRQPFPSMPVGFWNDDSGERYHNAYFARFDNLWAHGDFGEIIQHPASADLPPQQGVIIHGRSDAVLNPGGVRIGTAEIYRQVEKVDAVLEALAVGQEWADDVRVILFVKLKENSALTEELKTEIKTTIRRNTTPRHVPAKIIAVADIPRTISGKIVELAVRNIIHGEAVKNQDALANPEALALFKNLPELASD